MITRKEKIKILKAIAAGKANIEDFNDESTIEMWRPAADPGVMETFNCDNIRRVTNEQFKVEQATSHAMQITLNI